MDEDGGGCCDEEERIGGQHTMMKLAAQPPAQPASSVLTGFGAYQLERVMPPDAAAVYELVWNTL